MEGAREPEQEPRARSDAGTQARYFGPLQCLLTAHTQRYLLAPNPLRSLRVQRVGDERFLVRYDRRGLDASEVTPGNGSESNRTTTGRSQQRVCNECDAPPLSYLHEPDGDEGDEGAAASMAESSEKKDENEGGDEKKDEKKDEK
ncbi:unnamed protein product [Symbiodinium microadriaticum]|nr:unnamed protein product [Symbiodinium microadriaticum]CAE7331122.1 unnamed protein product [Symbiodinium sp. KB8]